MRARGRDSVAAWLKNIIFGTCSVPILLFERSVHTSMTSVPGFVHPGVFSASTSGFLATNRTLLLVRLAIRPWLVLYPVFLGKLRSGKDILKRFHAKKPEQRRTATVKPVDSFGILAIAVDPDRQGLGVGQILMDDAERAAVEHNFLKMDLTANPANQGAIRFYEKLNWTRVQQNGAWKGVMIKELGGSQAMTQFE